MSQRSIVARLVEEKGLVIVGPAALTLRRQRCGKGFAFVKPSGAFVRDQEEIRRLKALAVPPAYANVRFAADPAAHLQAIGEDAAGRLQYRYHPKWTEVREALKARRLAGLAKSLPAVRRAVGRCLSVEEIDRRFVAASIVELVRLTAIRAGGEEYAREHGTRGATTLLKSNVRLADKRLVTLSFKAKGGRIIGKQVRSARLHTALTRLLELPGRRLFQYREGDTMRPMRAAEVNAFLQEVAGRPISLKDFRTLVASSAALKALAATEPADSERQRRRQVREAVIEVAEELANTPTVCRTSYVHDAVIAAFEAGALKRPRIRKAKSPATQTEVLARIVSRHAG
ncbi:DNA topoisomerase IB [Reyranella soli]|jgi:DNA topoisomerase-1|uniref:DNA topoisomerase I n=1 Tax=Reyranella soli TaxID=1230389 RepID=A0A512N219_9HYPH|nr:DNA topoisomerase IB [Reyranella soli]GEP53028.1 DNA topoisomerase I [Reyranella soli]